MMMRMSRNAFFQLGGVIALSAGINACIPPPPVGVAYVRRAPPAVRVEVRGVAPGPGHIWVAGYYRWDSGDYVWVPGHWEARPRARARWVEGHWRHTRHGWYWVEGHWR